MVNLQNTPSSGPLTAEDLAQWRRTGSAATLTHCTGPCQQGRLRCPCPEACESMQVSEDALACATGIVRAVLWTLAIYAAGILALMVFA